MRNMTPTNHEAIEWYKKHWKDSVDENDEKLCKTAQSLGVSVESLLINWCGFGTKPDKGLETGK